MDFGFGEEQELLRATDAPLPGRAPVARSSVRRAMEGPTSLRPRPVAHGAPHSAGPPCWSRRPCEGGSVTAQPLVDLVVLAEELGRAAQSRARSSRPTSWPTPSRASALRSSAERASAGARPGRARPRPGASAATGRPSPTRSRCRRHREAERLAPRRRRPLRAGRRQHAGAASWSWRAGSTAARCNLPRACVRRRAITERTLSGLDLTRRFAEVALRRRASAEGRRAARDLLRPAGRGRR